MIGAAKLAARMPIEHAAEQWSGYCQRYSPGTRRYYQSSLARFIRYSHPVHVRDLTLAAFQTFLNSLLAGRKPQSLNKDIGAIRSFCRWLSQTYGIENPAARLSQMPVCDEESRFLEEDEYRKVLSVATDRNLALVKFLANTGLRVSEMISLEPGHLRGSWLIIKGKGRKTRTIYLNKTALETVHYAIQFTKSRHCVYQMCLRLAEQAGIAPFGPHALRHYHVTALLAKGADIHRVSKSIGHSSVTTTEKIYYHFRPEHLAGLTDCLE